MGITLKITFLSGMSKLLTPRDSPKNRKLDWINHIASAHNLVCGCNEPLKHTVEEIFHQEPELQKTCITTDHTDDHTAVGGFGDAELAALFDEGLGEPEDAGTHG